MRFGDLSKRKKEGHKRLSEANDETIGDVYCFVGIERHSKRVLKFALYNSLAIVIAIAIANDSPRFCFPQACQPPHSSRKKHYALIKSNTLLRPSDGHVNARLAALPGGTDDYGGWSRGQTAGYSHCDLIEAS
jgi:hypothetical protein